MPLSVAIIVVSDACWKDATLDQTGPALESFLVSKRFKVAHRTTSPDSVQAIQQAVTGAITSHSANVVLTCGGTGFSKRDVTPEAVRSLIEKEAPGIVHAMLSHSFKITPYAINARPIAGVIGESLVITLPGSKKGAKENLEAVVDMLDHICAQLVVDSARGLHSTTPLSTHTHQHTHSHSHTHGVARHILSNDLTKPVTQRARSSPYPMISVVDALGLINKYTPTSRIVTKSITDPDFAGHILAEDIYASFDVPSFNAAIVDGYAVIHTDCPGSYRITSISHAAPGEQTELRSGEIVRVTTGAPIPLGTTAVIPVEETELVSVKVIDGVEEEDEVGILATGVVSGDNIRKAGSDISNGELALKKGTKISSVGGEVGLLASIGVMEVKVYAKPIVGILSTGDELVDLEESPKGVGLGYGQIYDTNRPLLKQFFQGWGYEVKDLGIVTDKMANLEAKMKDALYVQGVDYLITTGGVSMGELDLLKPTIERKLEGEIHFGRVAMKPGKPTTFATLEVQGQIKAIFALPGNPASASVTTHLFVLPSLRKFAGFVHPLDPTGLPCLSEVEVVLSKDAKLDPRPEYQRVFVHQEGSSLIAESTGFQRSSRVGSVAGANALAILPSSNDVPGGMLPKGSKVQAMVIDVL